MSRFVLACDEGTSSARAIAFDKEARAVATAQRGFASTFPHSGWVEQDAETIWSIQQAVAEEAASRCGGWEAVDCIGITNQRETTVVWDRATGIPVAPAIVWQCRRTADACARLAAAGHASDVTARTGLVLDPYFSGTKIGWILDEVPDARKRAEAGELAFGTVDSWLVYRLSGGKAHVIDRTNASRTLLMDLKTCTWDDSMLSLLGVPRSMLPRIVPSSGVMAVTDGNLFGREIPIAGIAGDQQAALFGQACFRSGLVKNTYGTGCFALMHTGEQASRSQHKLLSTTAASPPNREDFALEGAVFVAGAVVQWLPRRAGFDRRRQGVGASGERRGRHGRCLLGPGVHRPGSPVLECRRARRDDRPQPGSSSRAHRASGTRIHRLPNPRLGRSDGIGQRFAPRRVACRRRCHGE